MDWTNRKRNRGNKINIAVLCKICYNILVIQVITKEGDTWNFLTFRKNEQPNS